MKFHRCYRLRTVRVCPPQTGIEVCEGSRTSGGGGSIPPPTGSDMTARDWRHDAHAPLNNTSLPCLLRHWKLTLHPVLCQSYRNIRRRKMVMNICIFLYLCTLYFCESHYTMISKVYPGYRMTNLCLYIVSELIGLDKWKEILNT